LRYLPRENVDRFFEKKLSLSHRKNSQVFLTKKNSQVFLRKKSQVFLKNFAKKTKSFIQRLDKRLCFFCKVWIKDFVFLQSLDKRLCFFSKITFKKQSLFLNLSKKKKTSLINFVGQEVFGKKDAAKHLFISKFIMAKAKVRSSLLCRNDGGKGKEIKVKSQGEYLGRESLFYLFWRGRFTLKEKKAKAFIHYLKKRKQMNIWAYVAKVRSTKSK
jgi:hypothetical protein